jgi:hypothetical protein
MVVTSGWRGALLLSWLSLGACAFDWDGFDPRQSDTTTSVASGGPGNTSAASSATSSGSGGAGGSAAGGAGGGGAEGGNAGGGGAPGVCTRTFGHLDGFTLCLETSTSCEFAVVHGVGVSCTDVCEAEGAKCVEAYSNGDVDPCQHGNMIDCTNNVSGSDICVCAL